MVRALAERQQGRVARRQLLAPGWSRREIDARRRAGMLITEYHGVYALGWRPRTPEGRWMAAVLACGEGAVLGFRSSGALWAIRASKALDVIVPHARKVRVPGITIRRARTLGADQVTTRNGIPVTTPSRTLQDLAQILHDDRDLERALGEARYLRLLGDAVPGLPGRKHPHRLAALDKTAQTSRTMTAGEEALLGALRAQGLEPLCNHAIRGASGSAYRADLFLLEAALVIEVDGGSHDLPGREEHDQARDADLALLGLRTLRLDDATVLADPPAAAHAVVARLRNDERRLAPAFG